MDVTNFYLLSIIVLSIVAMWQSICLLSNYFSLRYIHANSYCDGLPIILMHFNKFYGFICMGLGHIPCGFAIDGLQLFWIKICEKLHPAMTWALVI